MKSLIVTLWAEILKVRKSKVFWLSIVFFVFVAFMMGLMMFIQKHPEIGEKLGIMGTKAEMLRFGEPNWQNYFTLLAQGIAGVGMVGFGFITCWIFGYEYTDHTLKDMLALPVSRSSLVFSKLIVVMLWCIILAGTFLGFGLVAGYLSGISGWTEEIFLLFAYKFTMITVLTILLCTPIAFFASYSGGILLPMGIVILTIIMANFIGIVGLGTYFPWAIPGLFSIPSSSGEVPVKITSYIILFSTSILGLTGTLAWWRFADQK